MGQQATLGDNRTTRSQHPKMYDSMESGTEEFGPTSEGDGALLVGEVRAIYARAGGPIGHVPPVEGKAKPSTATVALIDKLGERLAFERSGARFYEALISKHDAYGSFDGGPSRGDLEDIRREEHEHFLMLHQVIVQMGGDPAAVTPSADLVTVVSRGVQDAVTDPRTNLLQGLEAILVAELSDTASWEMLIEIAAQAGQTQLQAAFQRAHESEEEHVEKVTAWIQAGYGLD